METGLDLRLRRLSVLPWLCLVLFVLPVMAAWWRFWPANQAGAWHVELTYDKPDPRLALLFSPGQLLSDGRTARIALPAVDGSNRESAAAAVAGVVAAAAEAMGARFSTNNAPVLLGARIEEPGWLGSWKGMLPYAGFATLLTLGISILARTAGAAVEASTEGARRSLRGAEAELDQVHARIDTGVADWNASVARLEAEIAKRTGAVTEQPVGRAGGNGKSPEQVVEPHESVEWKETVEKKITALTDWRTLAEPSVKELEPLKPHVDVLKEVKGKQEEWSRRLKEKEEIVARARAQQPVGSPLKRIGGDLDKEHPGCRKLVQFLDEGMQVNSVRLFDRSASSSSRLGESYLRSFEEAVGALENDRNGIVVALVGPAGTGKSSMAKSLPACFGKQALELKTIHSGWTPKTLEELVADAVMQSWKDGVTKWIVLDELNQADELHDIFGAIKGGLLDKLENWRGREVSVRVGGRELRVPVPRDLRIIVTMNPLSERAQRHLGGFDSPDWTRRIQTVQVRHLDIAAERALLGIPDGRGWNAVLGAIQAMRTIGVEQNMPDLIEGITLPNRLLQPLRLPPEHRVSQFLKEYRKFVHEPLQARLEPVNEAGWKSFENEHGVEALTLAVRQMG